MTDGAPAIVADHRPWLSQGDIFERIPVVQVGIRDAALTADWAHGPAMLVSHGCAIDKKHSRTGLSILEYLSFLPIQDVRLLDDGKAGALRAHPLRLHPPYAVFYLGHLQRIGEGYVPLVQPYTLPSALFAPELKDFADAETGDGDDRRIVPNVHDTRVGTLTSEATRVFNWKWTAQWSGYQLEFAE